MRDDPRQRNREACTGGKLQDGWPRKGEYRISTARCPPSGVPRTVENKEY